MKLIGNVFRNFYHIWTTVTLCQWLRYREGIIEGQKAIASILAHKVAGKSLKINQ
jgi:hypothetical protein